jgi:hypothetical protein
VGVLFAVNQKEGKVREAKRTSRVHGEQGVRLLALRLGCYTFHSAFGNTLPAASVRTITAAFAVM